MKFIVVLGGIMSSLGKGITASSVGVLMQCAGYSVTAVKIDPYLNCDAGTMSPHQHGEVFVLNDGGEVDLDLGNYERFLNVNLTSDHSITTGKIYNSVIQKERQGIYLGQTVQIVPHIMDEIIDRLEKISENHDVCIVELGGTIGDIESKPFLFALHHLSRKKEHIVLFMLVTHVPVIHCGQGTSEQKTKPTQHSVQSLRGESIWPSVVICRCEEQVCEETLHKISKTCSVDTDGVISCHNVSPIHKVPELFYNQGLLNYMVKLLERDKEAKLSDSTFSIFWSGWNTRIQRILDIFDPLTNLPEIHIVIVGKYTGKTDTYHSVTKAIHHACAENQCKVKISYKDNLLSKDLKETNIHGVIIPGGFGDRGIQNKIESILEARKQKLPLLGICLGLQALVIAAVRQELQWSDADSTEFNPNTKYPVVDIMPSYGGFTQKGSTMRRGVSKIHLINPKLQKLYQFPENNDVYERHRHRYEVSYEKYKQDFEKINLHVAAQSHRRVEAMEWPIPNEPDIFFFGTQYHPEFVSGPGNPSAPFVGLIQSAMSIVKK